MNINEIPTSEIQADLQITEKELKDYQDEKDVLERNPVENKVRIYMLGGHIMQRKRLIDRLKDILNERAKK